MTVRAGLSLGEDTTAAQRAVFGLTAGVGSVAAAASALAGDPLLVIGIPALAIIAARHLASVANAGGAVTGV